MILMKNHTTTLNNTINIMKSNIKEISDKLYLLHSETVTLAVTQKQVSKRILFNTLVNYLQSLLINYDKIQYNINMVLMDFKKGKLNPFLIDPAELKHICRSFNIC
ncbi:hypothetical protein ACFFRR_005288 [Megaselia abdita]